MSRPVDRRQARLRADERYSAVPEGVAARDHLLMPSPSPVAAAEESIVLRGVAKAFGAPGRTKPAVQGIDLTIGRGQFVTLIGPSGCGKSTLLRITAGLLGADAGTVKLWGRSPEEARKDKQIGLVPQSPALLPWRRVIDNVALPAQVNRRAGQSSLDPRQLLARVGLSDAAELRPHQLSGGMAQRVAIARALLSRPSVLLMDEPFSALDDLTRDVLRHVLLDVWETDRTTVVFVTHSMSEALILSDQVVVMSAAPGRITARVDVPLPRPRPDGIELTDEFRDLEAQLRLALHRGWNPRGA
ncbi:MAG: ABC transporter ATP-binding protein [Actinomycetota bacterium]|nr:ABC transporter ATP-binding protein [Actinomycetota bacterium]